MILPPPSVERLREIINKATNVTTYSVPAIDNANKVKGPNRNTKSIKTTANHLYLDVVRPMKAESVKGVANERKERMMQ
uniref:Uncharacterized protein n=1 Tax=Romanomermis culicivorax TaxID=13658 RepID=A0A915KH33_ROMCU